MIKRNNKTGNYEASLNNLGFGCAATAVANYLSQQGYNHSFLNKRLDYSLEEGLIDQMGNMTSVPNVELPIKLEKILGDNFEVTFFTRKCNQELADANKEGKIKTMNGEKIPSGEPVIGYSQGESERGLVGHTYLITRDKSGFYFIDSDGKKYSPDEFPHEVHGYFEIDGKKQSRFSGLKKKISKLLALKIN